MTTQTQPTRANIERRAYDIYLARGCEDGQDMADWLAAEQELAKMPATTMGAAMAVATKSKKREAAA